MTLPAPIPHHELFNGKLVLSALPRSWEALGQQLRAAGMRDCLVLEKQTPENWVREPDRLLKRYTHWRDVTASNCQIVILDWLSIFALAKKKYFSGSRVEKLLAPRGHPFSWMMRFRIKRYERKGVLTRLGHAEFTEGSGKRIYDVYSTVRPSNGNRRAYYPPNWSPLDALRSLEKLDYILLRSIENVENALPFKDLDLLINDDDIENLHAAFGEKAGTVAVDVYSADGSGGHDFNSVPYFLPRLSRDALKSADVRPSGVRSTDKRFEYLTLTYHTLFHAKMKHLDPAIEKLNAESFKKPGYWETLQAKALDAGYTRPETVSDLENALKEADYFPGLDLMAFYGRRNPFVAARYVEKVQAPAGLCIVYVRDFGNTHAMVEAIRSQLLTSFEILHEQALEGELQEAVSKSVRGGNWHDKQIHGYAEPVHVFVCWDENPVVPNAKSKRKFPNLDNQNIQIVKSKIRQNSDAQLGISQRVVHTNDNSAEALEHLTVLKLFEDKKIGAFLIEEMGEDIIALHYPEA